MSGQPIRKYSGIFRFNSLPPSKKIYGRLDFLKSSHPQKELERSFEKKQPTRRVASIDKPIESRTIELPSRSLKSPPHSQYNPEVSRTLQTTKYQIPATSLNKTIDLSVRDKQRTPNIETIERSFHPQSTQLSRSPKKFHDPIKCVCDHCTCGRHLCKFHTMIPSMQIESKYKQEYGRKQPVAKLAFRPAAEQDSTNQTNPTVDMGSLYLKDYVDRYEGKPSRPAPKDALKFKGPISALSSYCDQYPGHYGDNQYVKPTDRHFMQGPPLDSLSIYKKQYVNLLPKLNPDSPTLYKDSVKNLDLWMGDSSYRNYYRKPRTNDYQTFRAKMIEKRRIVPQIQNRFETIYRNEFQQKPVAVCKAKIMLDTMNDKSQFSEAQKSRAASKKHQQTNNSVR